MATILLFENFVDARTIATLIAKTAQANPSQVSPDVKKLQQLLVQGNYLPQTLKARDGSKVSSVDGRMGELTRKALAKYQKRNPKLAGAPAAAAPTLTKPNAAPAAESTNVAKVFQLKGESDYLKQPAELLFDGKQLNWVVSGQIKKSWHAISGNTVLSAGTRYDSVDFGGKYQQLPDKGPLPEGKYCIDAIQHQQRENNNYFKQAINFFAGEEKLHKAFNGTGARWAWGNSRCAIKPLAGTNTYGRHGFYIHGGTIPGSSGCIDLTTDMDDFAKTYGAYQANGNPAKMTVTVKYWK